MDQWKIFSVFYSNYERRRTSPGTIHRCFIGLVLRSHVNSYDITNRFSLATLNQNKIFIDMPWLHTTKNVHLHI